MEALNIIYATQYAATTKNSSSLVDASTVVSLFLTPWTLLMGLLVIYHWGPACIHAIKNKKMDSNNWLILGITIGFIGSVIDNTYWAYFWQLDLNGNDFSKVIQKYGIIINVVFKQCAGIISGMCHVMSAYMLVKSSPLRGAAILSLMCIFVCFFYALIVMGIIPL